MRVGLATPNVVKDKSVTINTDFTLGAEWTNLAELLQLSDPGVQDGIGEKRAYLIWLWMTTLWDQTFARVQDGGSYQIGIIGTLGATAFSQEMTTMNLEFPMLTIAQQLNLTLGSQQCEEFYINNNLVTQEQATSLCTNS